MNVPCVKIVPFMSENDKVSEPFKAGDFESLDVHHEDEIVRKDGNPVLYLLLILAILFVLGIVTLVFAPNLLDGIFGNRPPTD